MNIYKHQHIQEFIERFESRRSEVSEDVEASVNDILRNVRFRGDNALREYAQKFDNVDLKTYPIQVAEQELKSAHAELDPQLLQVLRESRENIKRFHEKGLPQSWLSWEEDQVVLGQRVIPIERVGVYVPG